MLSKVARVSLKSLRLAPATTRPSGTPRPSVSRLRFVPRLPRSVGLRPVFPSDGRSGISRVMVANSAVKPSGAARGGAVRTGDGAGSRSASGGGDEATTPVRSRSPRPLSPRAAPVPTLRRPPRPKPSGVGQAAAIAGAGRTRHQPRLSLWQPRLSFSPHGLPLGAGGSAPGERVGLWPGCRRPHRRVALWPAAHARRDLAPSGNGNPGADLRAARPEFAGGVLGVAARQPAEPA